MGWRAQAGPGCINEESMLQKHCASRGAYSDVLCCDKTKTCLSSLIAWPGYDQYHQTPKITLHSSTSGINLQGLWEEQLYKSFLNALRCFPEKSIFELKDSKC